MHLVGALSLKLLHQNDCFCWPVIRALHLNFPSSLKKKEGSFSKDGGNRNDDARKQ